MATLSAHHAERDGYTEQAAEVLAGALALAAAAEDDVETLGPLRKK